MKHNYLLYEHLRNQFMKALNMSLSNKITLNLFQGILKKTNQCLDGLNVHNYEENWSEPKYKLII